MRRQLLILDDRVVDAVVGYRAWRAGIDHGVVSMWSIARRDHQWRPCPIEAECRCSARYSTTKIGGPFTHRCGIYAWREPIVPVSPRLLGIPQACSGPQTIVGEVLLWGEIHIHAKGYRAQWAKASAFYVTETMQAGLRRMVEIAALQWDVPVVVVGGWPEGVLQDGRRYAP